MFRIPCSPVHSGATLLDDPQVRARGFYVEDASGRFRQPSVPFLFDGVRPPSARPLVEPRDDAGFAPPIERGRPAGTGAASGIATAGWAAGGRFRQLVGRVAGGHDPGFARGRRHQDRVDSPRRRRADAGRHHHRRRIVVGVRLDQSRRQPQQAGCDARLLHTARPGVDRTLDRRRRCAAGELRATGARERGTRLGGRAGTQPADRDASHARLRAVRTEPRHGGLRPDRRAVFWNVLAHRLSRWATDESERTRRSDGRLECGVRTAGRTPPAGTDRSGNAGRGTTCGSRTDDDRRAGDRMDRPSQAARTRR